MRNPRSEALAQLIGMPMRMVSLTLFGLMCAFALGVVNLTLVSLDPNKAASAALLGGLCYWGGRSLWRLENRFDPPD